jgi:hypothetical protein
VTLVQLASAVGQNQYKIVADVISLGQFKTLEDSVDFDTASSIAKKYGFVAKHVA